MTWHHIEQGSGRPLVLLHGISMSAAAWKTVMPQLARSVVGLSPGGLWKEAGISLHTAAALKLTRRAGFRQPLENAGCRCRGVHESLCRCPRF